MKSFRSRGVLAGLLCCGGAVVASGATVSDPPSYDFNWAVVDRPFNQAFQGPDPFGQVIGRGRVDYVYRISKLEITTRQWMEFVNTFSAQPSLPGTFGLPNYWGAEIVGSVTLPSGGVRPIYGLKDVPGVADTGLAPVAGITWREAAMYCNWLHNNKSSDLAAIMSGAYDVATFGQNGPNFTDQLVHSPGAKFWIPNLDEWLKASFYDPHRFGAEQEGWWRYGITSDTEPIPGAPGVGQTMAGVPRPPTGDEFDRNWLIPLGAYADVRSPWGLFDVYGGGAEWLEDAWPWPSEPTDRLIGHSHVMQSGDPALPPITSPYTVADPRTGGYATLRVASRVPAIGTVWIGAVVVPRFIRRRR